MNYFIAFCDERSAIYNSYRGMERVLIEDGVEACFFIPGSEDSGKAFFYNLRHPFLTVKSLIRLVRHFQGQVKKSDNLVIFNQGIFGFVFLMILLWGGVKLNVIQWSHEPFQFSRVGFLRGLYYFFSDSVVSFFVGKVVVSSNELVPIAKRIYRSKTFVVDLPMSFDFSSVDFRFDEIEDPRDNFLILFFGGINSYKNLDALAKASEPLLQEGVPLAITMLGVGDLEADFPIMKDLCIRFEVVCHKPKYFEASEIVSYLKKSSALYVNYKSVTATSQIDIANYFGVPVIVSDLPYFKEKVVHGVNGWIVRDDGELAVLLRNILSGEDAFKLSRRAVKDYNERCGANLRFRNNFYPVLFGGVS